MLAMAAITSCPARRPDGCAEVASGHRFRHFAYLRRISAQLLAMYNTASSTMATTTLPSTSNRVKRSERLIVLSDLFG